MFIAGIRDLKLCFLVTECYFQKISVAFSPGDFKEVTSRKGQKEAAGSTSTAAEPDEEDESQIEKDKQVFLCPEECCTRGFRRHSSLVKHLAFGCCTKTIERKTLLDRAKVKYAGRLQEGETSLPTITSTSSSTSKSRAAPLEGWALKQAKKAYRFNDQQRQYFTARFNIGQESGMKLDAEVVAKEMRRARGSDGERLFKVSEFLTAQQVASFFSRIAAKVKQQTVPGESLSEPNILAMEEEQNLSSAKRAVITALGVKHPISFEQYNICSMVKDNTLAKLKLGVLKLLCEKLSIHCQVIREKKHHTYLFCKIW